MLKFSELLGFGLKLIALTAMVNHANVASANRSVQKFEAGIDFFKYATESPRYGHPLQDEKFGADNFGLINDFLPAQPYTKAGEEITEDHIRETITKLGFGENNLWNRFKAKIYILNSLAPKNVRWKVVYFARHGEGFHNVAERLSDNWDVVDAKQEIFINPKTEEKYSLVDSDLTQKGIKDAEDARDYWRSQYLLGMPRPEAFFISPLLRTLRTADITFSESENNGKFGGIFPDCAQDESLCVPIIMEGLREAIGEHKCSIRSGYDIIVTKKPYFKFEDGFDQSNQDPYRLLIDSEESFTDRLKKALETIFSQTDDSATYIHLTMHDGAIRYASKAFKPLEGYKDTMLKTTKARLSELNEMNVADFVKKPLRYFTPDERLLWNEYGEVKSRINLLESDYGGGLPSVYLSTGGMRIVVTRVTYAE